MSQVFKYSSIYLISGPFAGCIVWENQRGPMLLLLSPRSKGAAARVSLGPFSLHDGQLWAQGFWGRQGKLWLKLTLDGAPCQGPFKKHML